MSPSVFLSTVDVAIRGCGVARKQQNNVFGRRDCDLDLQRPLVEDIDAEINDREC
jgi:hypothetical protein